MKYICEICGKTHVTPEAANQCEIDCQAEKNRKEQLRITKQERIDEIRKSIDAYNKDYNTHYRILEVNCTNPFGMFSII